MNYLHARRGRPADALRGQRRRGRRLGRLLRPVGDRQDDALGRPASAASSATTSTAGATTASSTSRAAATPRRSASPRCTSRTSSRRRAGSGRPRERRPRPGDPRARPRLRALHREHPRRLPARTSSATPTRPGSPASRATSCFLTADAFGVLPPISRLTREQAAYHFISGYTAKLAGTEIGVKEPKATFSRLLRRAVHAAPPGRVRGDAGRAARARTTSPVWLVNTGWTGGPYGTGERMNIAHTRSMVRAALDGALDDVADAGRPDLRHRGPARLPGRPGGVPGPARDLGRPGRLRPAGRGPGRDVRGELRRLRRRRARLRAAGRVATRWPIAMPARPSGDGRRRRPASGDRPVPSSRHGRMPSVRRRATRSTRPGAERRAGDVAHRRPTGPRHASMAQRQTRTMTPIASGASIRPKGMATRISTMPSAATSRSCPDAADGEHVEQAGAEHGDDAESRSGRGSRPRTGR